MINTYMEMNWRLLCEKILIISICIVLVVVSNVWNVKASISEDKEKIKLQCFYDEDNDYNIAIKNNLIEINERSNGNAELTFMMLKKSKKFKIINLMKS